MEDKNVPYIVYEDTMARFERTIKRLIYIVIITIVLLFATNAVWLYEWNQYDYSDVVVDGQTGGNAAYMGAGASGVINNGESSSQKQNEEK